MDLANSITKIQNIVAGQKQAQNDKVGGVSVRHAIRTLIVPERTASTQSCNG